MATTQDIRKAATDTAFAAAGVADITAEKIGHLVAEAPSRFEQLRNTDPKALGEKVTQRAKETQATVTTKVTAFVGTLDTDVKKLGQTAQEIALQGVGQAVTVAAKAGETFDKLAERGRTAVQNWRGEAAEELNEIAVAVEPATEPAAAEQQAQDDAGATGDDAKPAAARRTAAARKPAAKKPEAKDGAEQ
ncbi:gas vesicle protein [Streptomyces olivoverticillatus]|uniref:Gas vesicle protein n=1 Tax=Streptomyces olivoverticillatus TaxID=66427 RepID=A0A7W7LKS0_9ACTN|nr:hypothetical protein [Streptomyces olivoverticillatus]MBB4892045.1 gas vesicle protein [Streptomyces olivoverticillatus]